MSDEKIRRGALVVLVFFNEKVYIHEWGMTTSRENVPADMLLRRAVNVLIRGGHSTCGGSLHERAPCFVPRLSNALVNRRTKKNQSLFYLPPFHLSFFVFDIPMYQIVSFNFPREEKKYADSYCVCFTLPASGVFHRPPARLIIVVPLT